MIAPGKLKPDGNATILQQFQKEWPQKGNRNRDREEKKKKKLWDDACASFAGMFKNVNP